MISNERPSPFKPWHSFEHFKPPIQEDTLKSEQFQIERKMFKLTLRENPRGRFLRIIEDNAGRRNSIIIPAPGLEEFTKILGQMAEASTEKPPSGSGT